MKIALVDDDAKFLAQTARLVKLFLEDRETVAEVTTFGSAEELPESALKQKIRRQTVKFEHCALLGALLLAGCASLERTSPGMMDGLDVVGGTSPAEETVCVRNCGFGLLYICTAICGDVNYDRKNGVKGGCLLFQDKCNTTDCYRTLQAVANERGKKLTNVNMINNSLPNQGVTGWADYAGWFLETEDVVCSGVLRAK